MKYFKPILECLEPRHLLDSSIPAQEWNRQSMVDMYIRKFFEPKTPKPCVIIKPCIQTIRPVMKIRPKWHGNSLNKQKIKHIKFIKKPIISTTIKIDLDKEIIYDISKSAV